MCSAVIILLDRQGSFQGSYRSWLFVHLGRMTTYAGLGLIFGLLGESIWFLSSTLPGIQGSLSILFGIFAFYMALVFIGLGKSPELWISSLAALWGKAFRGLKSPAPFLAGILWGFLPCGLVITALLPVISSANAIQGALNMIVFGIATVPSLFAVRWLAQNTISRAWSRSLASMVMMILGIQFAMRGFASLGVVGHLMIGNLIIW